MGIGQKRNSLMFRGLFYIVIYQLIVSCSADNRQETTNMAHSMDDGTIKIISSPITAIDHNRAYEYKIEIDNKTNKAVEYKLEIPTWLSFDKEAHSIIGLADWQNLNKSFKITIEVFNDVTSVEQEFNVSVGLGEIDCEIMLEDQQKSPYILPFKEGKSFLVNQSYCPPNPSWGHHNWFAYDFEMPIGEEVLAMRSGDVIAIQETYNDGTRICGQENYIYVRHSDGTVASYYHLTKNGVYPVVGQKVNQGDILGLSGDSGCSIGPHLHIAVFRSGGKYQRQYSLPINFKNLEGNLNSNNGLLYNEFYKALAF